MKQATLDNFIIIKTLGKGVSGKVKLGKDKKKGCLKALKIIKKENKNFKRLYETLEKEFDILKGLKHKNIIKIEKIKIGTYISKKNNKKEVFYAILEYAPNGEIFDAIFNFGPFKEEIARYYAKQLMGAIEYLHKNNISHRDIKPENILLDENLHLKLSDFGFSTLINEKEKNKTRLGTVTYMSPQIVYNKVYDAKKSDIFAIGVLFFVFIFRAQPFKIATLNNHYGMFVKNPVVFWKKYRNKCSDSFIDMISKMWALLDSERYDVKQLRNCMWMNQSVDETKAKLFMKDSYAKMKKLKEYDIMEEETEDDFSEVKSESIEKKTVQNQMLGNFRSQIIQKKSSQIITESSSTSSEDDLEIEESVDNKKIDKESSYQDHEKRDYSNIAHDYHDRSYQKGSILNQEVQEKYDYGNQEQESYRKQKERIQDQHRNNFEIEQTAKYQQRTFNELSNLGDQNKDFESSKKYDEEFKFGEDINKDIGYSKKKKFNYRQSGLQYMSKANNAKKKKKSSPKQIIKKKIMKKTRMKTKYIGKKSKTNNKTKAIVIKKIVKDEDFLEKKSKISKYDYKDYKILKKEQELIPLEKLSFQKEMSLSNLKLAKMKKEKQIFQKDIPQKKIVLKNKRNSNVFYDMVKSIKKKFTFSKKVKQSHGEKTDFSTKNPKSDIKIRKLAKVEQKKIIEQKLYKLSDLEKIDIKHINKIKKERFEEDKKEKIIKKLKEEKKMEKLEEKKFDIKKNENIKKKIEENNLKKDKKKLNQIKLPDIYNNIIFEDYSKELNFEPRIKLLKLKNEKVVKIIVFKLLEKLNGKLKILEKTNKNQKGKLKINEKKKIIFKFFNEFDEVGFLKMKFYKLKKGFGIDILKENGSSFDFYKIKNDIINSIRKN